MGKNEKEKCFVGDCPRKKHLQTNHLPPPPTSPQDDKSIGCEITEAVDYDSPKLFIEIVW